MIIFQNTSYKTREIELSKFGNVLISTDTLNVKLLDKNGAYVSEKATRVDEQIFYFVEEYEMELPEREFKKLLTSQIK